MQVLLYIVVIERELASDQSTSEREWLPCCLIYQFIVALDMRGVASGDTGTSMLAPENTASLPSLLERLFFCLDLLSK